LFGSENQPVGRLEIARNDVADDQLRSWTYGAKLRWAADQRGRLTDRRKLKRIRKVSGYQRGWIDRVANRDWQEVLAEARQYRAEQNTRERERRAYSDLVHSNDRPPWED
jgi:hypothetical protein